MHWIPFTFRYKTFTFLVVGSRKPLEKRKMGVDGLEILFSKTMQDMPSFGRPNYPFCDKEGHLFASRI